MNVTYRTDKDILYIALEGRIDVSNAANVDKKIFEFKASNPGKKIIIDADCLEYISSAGLRVVLKLRKEEPDLMIINVSPEVYEVLDMTGFTDMIQVEKAFQRLSVEGCVFIAKGANGAVYRYDEETIVKVYFAKDALPEIQAERENARRAFVLGINTAIPYGVVRVGDGYGMVTELLNALSITEMIRNDPNDLSVPVKYYVDMLKSIHSTEAEPGSFIDMKKKAIEWANFLEAYLPADEYTKLCALINAVPDCNNLLHGDYNTNNIMIQNGEAVLIDMDTLAMGHPIFEMGSMFNAFLGFSDFDHMDTERFLGYTRETSERFWNLSLKAYLNTDDDALCRSIEEKAKVIGYMRLLRRAIRRPGTESPEKVEFYKQALSKVLAKVDSIDF